MSNEHPGFLQSDSYEEYDRFVKNHPCGWVCSTSQWIKILEQSFPRIKSHSIIFMQDGIIGGALPIFSIQSPITGNRLVSVPFATLSDPLLTSVEEVQMLQPMLASISSMVRSKHIEIRTSFGDIPPLLPDNFQIGKTYKCHTISLESPLDTIYKNFHRTCVRQNISRAEKSDVVVREARDLNDIHTFYRLYCFTRKQLSLPAIPFVFFRSIWQLLHPINQVFFLIAQINETPIASMMLFKYGKRVSAEAMGWNTAYTQARPVAYIYWDAIRRAVQEGFTVFDFGRTDPDNTALMEFKGHWGATVSDLYNYRYPAQPVNRKRLVVPERLLSRVRMTLRKIPDSLYCIISTVIYRHVG